MPAPGPGCQIAGYLEVKRVPGSFGFRPALEGVSANAESLNLTHSVNELFFGPRVSAYQLSRLPAGTGADLHRLRATYFASPAAHAAHEHYLSVVSSAFRFSTGHVVEAFRYSAVSHVFEDPALGASARWRYELSPLAVTTAEVRQPLYTYLTSLCAILGGVFTVISFLDTGVHALHASVGFKGALGKRS